jgi:hypothetical protein
MSGDADAPETDRALAPPGHLGIDSPRWICPQCDYSTRGTIDEPYVGDGTCPQHSRQVLQLVRPGDYPTGAESPE